MGLEEFQQSGRQERPRYVLDIEAAADEDSYELIVARVPKPGSARQSST